MALSLAACGGEDDTPFAQADIDAATAPLEAAVAAAETAQAAAEADAAAALVAQAAAEADAAAALVAQAAAEADAATALVAQAAAEASAAAATVAAAEATAAKEAAEAAQATAEAALATAQADLTAKTAEYDALAASNTTLQAQYDALVAPVAQATTTATDTLSGSAGDDTFTATQATLEAADIVIDNSSTDNDTINITATDDLVAGDAATIVGVENVNYTIQAFATAAGTGTVFDVDASGVAPSTISLDVDQVGTSIVSASVTGIATGSTLIANADFTGTVTASGDDNASITVNTASAVIAATSGAGALTGSTLTSTSAGAVTGSGNTAVLMSSNSDAATVMNATGTNADLEISAAAATSVTATATGSIVADNSVDANSANLTAATTVNLTAVDEITAEMTAATAATLSAGFGDAATVTVSAITGAALTDVNLSGNGSAPTFNTEAATAVDTINISGDQNVTVQMGLDDVAALAAANALTVTDTSSGTSTVSFVSGTGAADLTNVAADSINLGVANNAAVTYASGANVTVSANQAAGTFDGSNAGAATNTLTVTLNDGNATNTATNTLNGVTFTDLASVTIDGSVDDAGTTLTAITASADNTDITVNAGSNGVTLAGTTTLGTGDLVINSTGAIAGGATALTANSLTTSGSGALTMTAIDATTLNTVTSDSGADNLTISNTGASATISVGAGNDTVNIGANTTALMTYTLDGGDGFDTLGLTDATDVSGGTLVATGFERINIIEAGTNGTSAVTIDNADITGQTYIMTTDEAGVVTLTISMAAGEAISDLSGLTFDNTFAAANDIMVVNNNVTTNLTVTGSDMINQITTGAGSDTITGGGAADVIAAANGANTINAGGGADVITSGTGVDTIDGGAGGDTITSGTGNDAITAGEGADFVVAGGGSDTIELTETTSAADNVQMAAVTDGSAAGTAAGTFSGFDVITGFTSGTDDVVFDSDVTTGNIQNDTVDTDIVAGTVFVVAGTAATVALSDVDATNYTSVDQIVNFYNDVVTNAGGITTDGANDDILAITFGTGANAMTAIYSIDDDSAAVDATEIMLIATVDATMVAGDIIA